MIRIWRAAWKIIPRGCPRLTTIFTYREAERLNIYDKRQHSETFERGRQRGFDADCRVIFPNVEAMSLLCRCFVTPWKAGEPARRFGVRVCFLSHFVPNCPICAWGALARGSHKADHFQAIRYRRDAGVGKGQVSQVRKSSEVPRKQGLLIFRDGGYVGGFIPQTP
jgi:hypothetical protein